MTRGSLAVTRVAGSVATTYAEHVARVENLTIRANVAYNRAGRASGVPVELRAATMLEALRACVAETSRRAS